MAQLKTIYDHVNTLVKKYASRDPLQLAEFLGIHIYYVKGFADLLGMYTIVNQRRAILLNNNLDEHLLRLVVAHEIGHDRLHRDLAKQCAFKEFQVADVSTKPEYEANVFAAHLLIDDVKLISLIKEGYDVVQLACILDVNANLLLIKLNEMKRRGADYNISYVPHGDFLKKIKADIS
ncbi:MAG: ImmA/IrrE family metallo-endopeptidase [Proteocatella sp.]